MPWLKSLTFTLVNLPLPRWGFVVRRDLAYGPDWRQQLDNTN